ncbi:unnamed protein product [Effrenium voratum]|nr:unnamed protein product [Effrenium voratum]
MWRRIQLALLPSLSLALFADEVGQYDWSLKQIGKPTALAFSGENPDSIYAATQSGVVASMSMQDGSLQWRRVASTEPMALLRPAGRGLISATDTGLVQAWKGAAGDLSWQKDFGEKVLDLVVLSSSVLVLRDKEVEARNLAGKSEWMVSSKDAGAQARYVAAAASKDSVCLLASLPAGGSILQKLDLNGKVLEKVEVEFSVPQSPEAEYMVMDAHLAVLKDGTLSVHPICGGGSETMELPQKSGWRLQPWQQTKGVFAITDGATTSVFSFGSKGLRQLKNLDQMAVVGPVFGVSDDETGQLVALAMARPQAQIQLMDPASGNVQPAVKIAGYTAAERGECQLLLVHETRSGEHRAVMSAADHSLAGIQSSKVSWVREEGLASIRQADLYSRHTLADKRSEDKSLGAQLANIPGHLAELLKAPFEILNYVSSVIMARRQRKDGGLPLMPDAVIPFSSEELRDFGADKLILALSSAPKLFALQATTSEVVWTKYLGIDPKCSEQKPGTGIDPCTAWMQLLPSSASPHAELVVIAPKTATKPQKVMWMDPLTGKVLHEESMPNDITAVTPLPHKGKNLVTHPLLLIDSKGGLQTLPKDATELQEAAGNLFHYEVDTVNQVIKGFAVPKAKRPSKLMATWNMEVGSLGERILAAATPQHRHWDHVPVHIKGDASILYKYINPNFLAVVSEDKNGLNLYMLDAVTGHLLHQSQVAGGAGPVHLAACDNWVVMHYQNPKKTRFEMLVTEFFQAKADDGPWEILFGKQGVQTRSAHQLERPVPLQQTYIVPAGVTAMGVTATLKGITPRSIILALTTDHLTRISKDILNPRRPYPSMTPNDKKSLPSQFAPTKDEPLAPYTAQIPWRHTEMLNYYHALHRVTGIASSPTALESTSLVFAYGLDLFFTPMQSAKAYDVLSPGFNYLLLYGSVGVVVVVWATISMFASRKMLQDRWK